MDDPFEELDNFLDDDPGLDLLLYDDMDQEGNKKTAGGCFGISLNTS